ncbi:MAG: LuxR family transcriptional regulator [Coriobacteriia bacterium]|nr:LuxR family transcriptional regulator [Coriobacteriia bacterium]
MRSQKFGLFATLLCLTFGLVIAGTWSNVVGYSIALLPADLTSDPRPYDDNAFLWGRFFVGIVLIVFARKIPRVQFSVAAVVAVITSFATGAIVIAYQQNLVAPEIFSAVSVFLAGGGYAFLVILFYILLAQRVKTSHAIICIAVFQALETILSLLISLLCPTLVQICIVVLAPIAAVSFYFAAEHFSKGVSTIDPLKKAKGSARNALLLQCILFAMLMALIRVLSSVGTWGETRTNYLGMSELLVGELIAISALLLLLTYLIFVLPQKRVSLQARCLIAFAALLAGLQVLAFTNDYELPFFFDTVTTAIELFAHVSYWAIVIVCIRETDIPAFRVASIAWPFSVFVFVAWDTIEHILPFSISTFVMIVIYVLFIVIFFLVFSGRIFESLSTRAVPQDSSNKKLDAFARKWNLSQREAQVFELLLAGKKRSEIGDECDLSMGTVKTHVSNIYRKLDVHSKSEMIVLFNKNDSPEEADSDSQI